MSAQRVFVQFFLFLSAFFAEASLSDPLSLPPPVSRLYQINSILAVSDSAGGREERPRYMRWEARGVSSGWHTEAYVWRERSCLIADSTRLHTTRGRQGARLVRAPRKRSSGSRTPRAGPALHPRHQPIQHPHHHREADQVVRLRL